MKRTNRRLWVCSVLLLLILTFIWGNSALPGTDSRQMSDWARRVLTVLFPFLPLDAEAGMYVLRKLAHGTEFAVLGMNLAWLFGMWMPTRPLQVLCPLGCGIMVAGIDETIQRFSPGRFCSILDVCIDTGGVLVGIMLLFLGHAVYRQITRK